MIRPNPIRSASTIRKIASMAPLGGSSGTSESYSVGAVMCDLYSRSGRIASATHFSTLIQIQDRHDLRFIHGLVPTADQPRPGLGAGVFRKENFDAAEVCDGLHLREPPPRSHEVELSFGLQSPRDAGEKRLADRDVFGARFGD